MRYKIIILITGVVVLMAFFYVYFLKQNDPVVISNLLSLEETSEFFKKNDLWHIKLENNQYVFFDKNEKTIKNNQTDFFITDLSKNHVSFVYWDANQNIYFDITDSDKIYVFSSEWFNVKIWELMWVWKVKKVINKNWIVLDECTRVNCPELDK